MSIEVYTEESLFNSLYNKKLELKSLAEEFKIYKENKIALILGFNLGSSYFGKDELLTQPPTIRGVLHKIHFRPDGHKKAKQAWNRCIGRGGIPTSDHILLYSQGMRDCNKYLLIDIFKPDGHIKMKDMNRLLELKINFADPFRKQF